MAEFRLREIRQRLGMSQKEVAKLCGLPQSQISHYECKAGLPNWENAGNIAIALGCSLDELAGLTRS